jgi:hypothetical protein
VKEETQALWLGRAFPLDVNPFGGEGRTRLTLAGSLARKTYMHHPASSEVLARFYRNRTLLLASLTLNRSTFRKGRLIHGTGRTEDLPSGFLCALAGGYEHSEMENRPYAALVLRLAGYRIAKGYLAGTANWGGYLREGRLEDAQFELEASAFSKLIPVSRLRLRQFVWLSYLLGIRRREAQWLLLDERSGLQGMEAPLLRGRQRLAGRLESVFFTPWRPAGFEAVLFGACGAGMIGPDNKSFWSAKPYASFGLGVRLKNDRLVFDAIELRMVFFPRRPPGPAPDLFAVSNVEDLRFVELDPVRPSSLEFR